MLGKTLNLKFPQAFYLGGDANTVLKGKTLHIFKPVHSKNVNRKRQISSSFSVNLHEVLIKYYM